MPRRKPLVISLLSVFVLLIPCAHAQTLNLTSTSATYTLTADQTYSAITVQNGVSGVITGAGHTLTYTGATAAFFLGSTTNAATQSLNMSGLGNFTFNNPGQRFSVGGHANGGTGTGNTIGTMTLASGANVITASSFGVGDVTRAISASASNVGTLNLGRTNTINTQSVTVGANQANGTLHFASGISGGTLVLRGTDGVSPVTTMSIGTNASSNYTPSVGLVDLSAGSVDASVTNLLIGQASYGAITNVATGTLILGTGSFTAATTIIGQQAATEAGAGTVTGTLTINNATFIAQTLTLGDHAGSTGSVVATINLNGGALLAGTIAPGAGSASRAFNWNGGTIGNLADGQAMTITLPTIALAANGGQTFAITGDGAVASVSSVLSGPGGFIKSGAGVLVLSGVNTYAGGTTVAGGLVNFSTPSNLGTGNITLDGGGLQWATGNDADISARLNALGANGAVFDTNGNDVTLAANLSGAGGQLIKIGEGTLTLTGANTYDGTTDVLAGTLAVIGSIQSATTTIGTDGTLAGSGLVRSDVVNHGAIWPGAAIAGDTNYAALTVAGNYLGQGGRLIVNSELSGDGAPSDRLILDGGAATGSTGVVVHNTADVTSLTSGDGILVVSAVDGGTTSADAFYLQGEARSGVTDYRLYRGGLNGGNPQSWYLRNEFVVPPTPVEPGEPVITPEPPATPEADQPETTLPDTPPQAPLPPGTWPIIGPEIATYSAIQPIARQLGMLQLGTLDQRVGEYLLAPPQGTAGSAGSVFPSMWVRVFADHSNQRYQTFTAAQANGDTYGFQAGVDVWNGSLLPGHTDRVGGYVSYANEHANIDGLVTNDAATAYVMEHTGTINLYGTSVGAYWTHYGPGDWYVDGVLQATWYGGTASTAYASLPTTGTGQIGSLEFGFPIAVPLPGPVFVLQPEAQIVWQRVSLHAHDDGLGEVAPGQTNGVSARLGLRAKWQWQSGNGTVWSPYLAANFWRDWNGQAITTYSGVSTVPVSYQASRFELSAGLTAQLLARLTAYARAGIQFAVGNTELTRRDSVGGEVGVRWTW